MAGSGEVKTGRGLISSLGGGMVGQGILRASDIDGELRLLPIRGVEGNSDRNFRCSCFL